MILYHGSNIKIDEVCLSKCHNYKDFGQSFYLTLDKKQAIMVGEAKVSIFGGNPVLNMFEFDESLLINGTRNYFPICFLYRTSN